MLLGSLKLKKIISIFFACNQIYIFSNYHHNLPDVFVHLQKKLKHPMYIGKNANMLLSLPIMSSRWNKSVFNVTYDAPQSSSSSFYWLCPTKLVAYIESQGSQCLSSSSLSLSSSSLCSSFVIKITMFISSIVIIIIMIVVIITTYDYDHL